jgi:hypothetical protein
MFRSAKVAPLDAVWNPNWLPDVPKGKSSAKVAPLDVSFASKVDDVEEIPLDGVKPRGRRNAYVPSAWGKNEQNHYKEKGEKDDYYYAAMHACERVYRGQCCCGKPNCGVDRNMPGRCYKVCPQGLTVFYRWFSMPNYQDIANESLIAVRIHRASMPEKPKRSLFGRK